MAEDKRYSHLTDEELLHAYRSSEDAEWLGRLLQRYTALLLGVAMKYLKDKMMAEDAVQHVFLKALTHLPKEEINNFKGWLYILVRNHCFQVLRDKVHNIDTDHLTGLAAPVADKEEIQIREYNLQQMTEGLKTLNDEQRVSITLFYLQKKTYEQIMKETGYTFMQVKSFIQNGKRNLKMYVVKKTANGK